MRVSEQSMLNAMKTQKKRYLNMSMTHAGGSNHLSPK
jgi:hypothetical protein